MQPENEIILSFPKPFVPCNGFGRYHVRVPNDWQSLPGNTIIVPIIDGPIYFDVFGSIVETTSASLKKEEIEKHLSRQS